MSFQQRVFLEGNPYLLAITMFVSLLHSVFDFLAFKNGNDTFYHIMCIYAELAFEQSAEVLDCLQIFSFGIKTSPWRDYLQNPLWLISFVS